MSELTKRAEVRVGLIGLGTVGSGVVQVLRDNQQLIRRRLGAELTIVKAADRDPARAASLGLPVDVFTTSAEEVLYDPTIHILVELIGGYDPAERYLLEAMHRGKCVVTANKALLATAGGRLFEEAVRAGVDLGFEASVGGGIPILRALTQGLAGNRFLAIHGIVNGTANFILTQMTAQGRSFDEALAQATAAGYAEADPTLDIDGVDSAHKLAIMAMLAFGSPINVKEIYTEGIRHLDSTDVAYARELGFRVKLLAIAKRGDQMLELRVHPTMVPADELIADVEGVDNAIFVVGDAVGETLFCGQGAGKLPTASAVVSDLISIGRNLRCGAAGRLSPIGYHPKASIPVVLKPMAEVESLYYLRFQAYDRPGVLSKIAGMLGRHEIGIASVIQKSRARGEAVPLVMMTHKARERQICQALEAIDASAEVAGRTVMLRIEAEEAGDGVG